MAAPSSHARKPEGMRPQTSRSRPDHVPPAWCGQDPRLINRRNEGAAPWGVSRPFRLEEAALLRADPSSANLPLLTVRLIRAKYKKRGGIAAPQAPRRDGCSGLSSPRSTSTKQPLTRTVARNESLSLTAPAQCRSTPRS
jgi:hypothetical protein